MARMTSRRLRVGQQRRGAVSTRGRDSGQNIHPEMFVNPEFGSVHPIEWAIKQT